MLIAILFGFRGKGLLEFIAAVNLATQLILNVVINLAAFYSGALAFVAYYILLEIAVTIAEAITYIALMRKFTPTPPPTWKPILYSLTANAASFALGLWLAHVIPGVF